MKKGIYRKLAWMGIKKNRKLYMPYLLTCAGMVMMTYLISFLSKSDAINKMPGGETLQGMLSLGFGVMGFFSFLFLFYTNSFLTRRRKKEFGLFNILGMGKGNIALVLLWETILTAAFSFGGGLFFGITFSKFGELILVNLLNGTADFTVSVSMESISQVVGLFAVIFLVIYGNMLRQIHLSKPIELLESENTGERPPKANWVLALLGCLLLGGAYYLAVMIQDPVVAFLWFFLAVEMVIAGTYLLFVSGSVAVCRLLQKKKSYYYKTSHFVSVSSMMYRMKRNGAGLASICILCTMVLVMVSSTVCLFAGTEDSLKRRYPMDINLDIEYEDISDINKSAANEIKKLTEAAVKEERTAVKETQEYYMGDLTGVDVYNGKIDDYSTEYGNAMPDGGDWQVILISLQDYNRLMNREEKLKEDEVLLYTTKSAKYEKDTIAFGDRKPLKIKKQVDSFISTGVDGSQIYPTMYIIVPDFLDTLSSLKDWKRENGKQVLSVHWIYGFNLKGEESVQIRVQNRVEKNLAEVTGLGNDTSVTCNGYASEKTYFYSMYGSLLFLGVFLGIAFIFAAVLIIYYKQVSEGYEDQAKFEIMQKVGMTDREIRKSINSQILTVFFLPLALAGVHLCFAFPFIYKLLVLLSVTNKSLLLLIMACCYLVFALFYAIVYRGTSKAYYSIVTGGIKERRV